MSAISTRLCLLVQAANGVAPGAHIHLKSTSEMLRLTVAYAAAGSFLRALLEWRDLHAAEAGDAYRRQLAAADASSLHTLVDNALGVPAQLQLDFGDHMCVRVLGRQARQGGRLWSGDKFILRKLLDMVLWACCLACRKLAMQASAAIQSAVSILECRSLLPCSLPCSLWAVSMQTACMHHAWALTLWSILMHPLQVPI